MKSLKEYIYEGLLDRVKNKEVNHEALIKELQSFVKQNTAPYKYPRIIEFVDSLPKTFSGKIQRTEIRKKDNEKLKV